MAAKLLSDHYRPLTLYKMTRNVYAHQFSCWHNILIDVPDGITYEQMIRSDRMNKYRLGFVHSVALGKDYA